MSATAGEILASFRDGTLSAEEAARQLLPLLQSSGKLSLEFGPEVRPVLEALRQLAMPGQPSAKEPPAPLDWESPLWRSLHRVPDDLWTIMRDRHLDMAPQCLRYVFTVRSAAAAATLEDLIGHQPHHRVTVEIPASFQQASGHVTGETHPRLLTKSDLVTFTAWLRSIPPIADAALTDLGIQAPPRDTG
jgi:hypothetical protein